MNEIIRIPEYSDILPNEYIIKSSKQLNKYNNVQVLSQERPQSNLEEGNILDTTSVIELQSY